MEDQQQQPAPKKKPMSTGKILLIIFLSLFFGGILIVALLAAMLYPALAAVKEKSNQVRCKGNLDQIGKAMTLYLDDFGRSVRYPAANGEGFIATLFQDNVLMEETVYLCPSTPDMNTSAELLAATGEGDSDGPVSYAGRKNSNQMVYPGIFRPYEGVTTTPIAADDWDGNFVENHEGGEIIIFLFLDGHTDHVRERNDPVASMLNGTYREYYDPLAN